MKKIVIALVVFVSIVVCAIEGIIIELRASSSQVLNATIASNISNHLVV